MTEPTLAADDGRMTLVEHLTELRRRLMISVAAIGFCSIVVFVFSSDIVHFLEGPYDKVIARIDTCGANACDLSVIDPLAPFMVKIKIATYGGIVLALPIVMFQLWRFVTPGLHSQEKRYAIPFLLSAVLLFLAGGVIAWFTLEKALGFLLVDVGGGLQPNIVADKYLNLVMFMFLAFGAAFEFPVLLVFMLLVGAISTGQLRRARRHAAVGIVIVAAVITPSQDPYSLFFMAGPMYLFYEMSILIGRVMKR